MACAGLCGLPEEPVQVLCDGLGMALGHRAQDPCSILGDTIGALYEYLNQFLQPAGAYKKGDFCLFALVYNT